MFMFEVSWVLDSLLIFTLAFLVDCLLGELPDRFHPTLWMGKIIEGIKPKLSNKNPRIEKINGVLLCLLITCLFAVPTFFILHLIRDTLGWVTYILASAAVLQSTFAIKCMRQYTLPVAEAVEAEDYEKTKELLPFIVRRNPDGLTKQNIISAAVETIAEGTTDGVTSPFFYFALFGVPGAVVFRAVNTLDSMVGYKDQKHINIGWFSAKMDTLVNYVPARFTAVLMVLAAMVLGNKWRKAWRILQRDKNVTVSPNAGWTISAMAGALDIQLEKVGHYKIGDNNNLKSSHIKKALQIMLVTSVLFVVFVVVPILVIKGFLLF